MISTKFRVISASDGKERKSWRKDTWEASGIYNISSPKLDVGI